VPFVRSGSGSSRPLTRAALESEAVVPNFLARSRALRASEEAGSVVPKRWARFWRLRSSSSRVVVGTPEVKLAGGGLDSAGFSSVRFSLEGLETSVAVLVAVSVVVGAASAVDSEALEGSMAGIWLGTAVGLATRPRPPAARAAAAGSEVAGGSVVMGVSSSQSISSSTGVVVGFAASLVAVEAALASDSWMRAMSSSFLPVWGRARDLRISASSAFFFLE